MRRRELRERKDQFKLIKKAHLEYVYLDYLNKKFIGTLDNDHNGANTYAPNLYAGMLFNVSMAWLDDDCKETIKSIAQTLVRYLFRVKFKGVIMEFYEVINKRRSIRQFTDKAIPQEVIERILDAGLKAPSSNHQRSWELVVYTDKEKIKALAQIVKPYYCNIQEPKSPQQEMFKIAYPRQRTMIEECACVILPYFKCKYGLTNPNGYGLMDYGAAWALVENILLAATAEGLGSVVHIPVKKEPQQINDFANAKDGYILPAMIMTGYAAPDAQTPKQVEVTVEKKAHWNKW